MKKIISWLCIIIGVGLLLYPSISRKYYEYEQKKLLAQWQNSFSELEIIEEVYDTYNDDGEIGEDMREGEGSEEEEDTEVQEEPQEEPTLEKEIPKEKKPTAEGLLKIAKINLELPILTNATQKNLAISIASIKNTGKPGQEGNYGIAGHRNRTYGKNFNRLDELVIGDVIEVVNNEGNYQYIVEEILRVLPEEVSVLYGKKGEREITLVTCDPIDSPTHRLIVKGRVINQ